MNQRSRKWICPCQPHDKPVTLFRDELTSRLLEVSRSDELFCTINEQLEFRFSEKRVFRVQGQ